MANDHNLIPAKKGEIRNPNGRPKKIYTLLRESGFGRDDIRTAMQEAGWQTAKELQAIIDDETKPAILKIIARAFIKGAEKGDYRYISEIMQQAIGKPTEQTENKHLHKIVVEYVNPNDKAALAARESEDSTEPGEEV